MAAFASPRFAMPATVRLTAPKVSTPGAAPAINLSLLGPAFATETECLVTQHLVGGEAVVEFDDIDVVRAEARSLIDLGCGGLGHVGPHRLHHAILAEGRWGIGRHSLGDDFHRAREAMPANERVTADDRGRRATGRRTGLEPGQIQEQIR